MTVPVHVRPAEPADAAALAAVHARSARARGGDPEAFLAELERPGRDALWRQRLAGVLVATDAEDAADAGTLTGFVWFGAALDDPGFGEVYLVAVDPDHWRSGIGTALLAAAVPALGALGFDGAILWTADDHTAAHALCRAAGWVADGATRVDQDTGVDVPSSRFRHPIAAHA
jgi:ribosomal protein S18 acetylase RimI-like enzyme